MYEIELKARVKDRKAVISSINSFGIFASAVQKDDSYWKSSRDGNKISVRIRSESPFSTEEIPFSILKNAPRREKSVLLTYKRKESRLDENGTVLEVNDEKECRISDSAALEALFADLGFSLYLKKHKSVLAWKFQDALLELCTVPPLGDFLEIEIMSPVNDGADVENLREKLKNLLRRAGLSENDIENRYYSEMLAEVNNEK